MIVIFKLHHIQTGGVFVLPMTFMCLAGGQLFSLQASML